MLPEHGPGLLLLTSSESLEGRRQWISTGSTWSVHTFSPELGYALVKLHKGVVAESYADAFQAVSAIRRCKNPVDSEQDLTSAVTSLSQNTEVSEEWLLVWSHSTSGIYSHYSRLGEPFA